MRKIIALVSVSGGKDSQAALNYILKKCKKTPVVAYFCDTGWEAPETYEHIKYLEKALNIKIHKVGSKKYENFEDMCIKRKAFPSRVRRFCTEELKIIPSNNFIKSYQDKGYTVINIVGVRNDESKTQKLKEPKIINGVKWLITPKRDIENKWKFSFFYPCNKKIIKAKQGVLIYQPILDWTAQQVLEYNLKCGTKNNPLYSKGYTRVGCYPCINANTTEIGLLDENRVNKIVELEKKVQATTIKTKPVFFHKGGKLLDFKTIHQKYKFNALNLDLGCINQFGICE